MSANKRARVKGRGGKASFLMLRHDLLNHENYLSLSPSAKVLLVDTASQYKGANNGDLCLSWTLMQPRGWKSPSTLNKAKKELTKAGFIVVTKQGHFPKTASLYAITWQPIDECKGKHDHPPSKDPLNWWKLGGEPKLKKVA